MTSIQDSLISVFKLALKQAYPELVDPPCPVTISAKQGDYQFNGAMAISGLFKVNELY